MTRAHHEELAVFTAEKSFRGKGPISVALVVTQHAKTMGLPLNPDTLITEGGGQVLGLGKGAVQSILKRHGIDCVLAAEGGRTSRGSLGNMREYVAFLNGLSQKASVDLQSIEAFWIDRVHEFFAGKPFKIKLDASRSLPMVVRDVIGQAVERQKTMHGVYYAGAVLQHLFGAKLDCALGKGHLQHNSFSTADAPRERAGDFFLGDVAIHVTTSPGEAVIERCRENLNDGHRPILVTIRRGLNVAARFAAESRKTAVTDLVSRYNEIVEEFETDPSLKIELRR